MAQSLQALGKIAERYWLVNYLGNVSYRHDAVFIPSVGMQ